jgi:peptidoglycan/LPS O-acetylase OafA/YrhL
LLDRGWTFYALLAGALGLALAGGIVYLVDQSDLAWWLGGAASIPLVILAIAIDKPEKAKKQAHVGGDDGGPWAAP